MSGDAFDLDAYLARIGYPGPRSPTEPVLRMIVARHTATIPFENIEVFARHAIPLDSASLQQKMVQNRRGGYCFEHNLLLRDALGALGFQVTGLMARVIRGMPDTAVTPRTHMLLRVDLPEGPHLADVGFGNLTPTAPLLLSPGQEQQTPQERYRLMPMGEELVLQASLADVWQNVYRFPLQPQFQIDYELANWFTSTRPGGVFIENLVLARPGAGCRMTLFNNRFTVRHLDGHVDRRELSGADNYRTTLAEAFGLMLSDTDLIALATAAEQRASQEDAHPFFV